MVLGRPMAPMVSDCFHNLEAQQCHSPALRNNLSHPGFEVKLQSLMHKPSNLVKWTAKVGLLNAVLHEADECPLNLPLHRSSIGSSSHPCNIGGMCSRIHACPV